MASLEDFRSNVQQLSKLGVKFIDLTGGEPLLHKDIAEMARIAKDAGMQTSITTNCLLYHKYAESLKGVIDLLHFSLDSPDEEEHNKIRGITCFQSVMKSITLARSLGEFPDILFTVTNETYLKLPQMYKLAQDNKLVLIVNPVFSYFGNEGLHSEALAYITSFVKGKPGIYINDSYLRLRRNGGNQISSPLCKAVSRVIVISPNNEIVLPCYHFRNETIPIDRPIEEIRKSERIKYFQSMEGRFEFCQGCTVNCYFEPSFAFPFNSYGIGSIPSKVKYGYNKLIKQRIQKLLHSKNTGK
jgi:MoaA/NifB/PqqE/SkfB family radical SAM enzyme